MRQTCFSLGVFLGLMVTLLAPLAVSAERVYYSPQSDYSYPGQNSYGSSYGSSYGTQRQSITGQIGSLGAATGLPMNSSENLLLGILLWILRIFTILAVLAFIISGVFYLIAGANKDFADKAKDGVTYAILGIVVALSAYILLNLIFNLLSGTEGGGFSFTLIL